MCQIHCKFTVKRKGGTSELERQLTFFREVAYLSAKMQLFRARKRQATPAIVQATFITRENPLEQALFGEKQLIILENDSSARPQTVRKSLTSGCVDPLLDPS